MNIGVKTKDLCLHHSVLYFGETSMPLCHIVSGNIRYVEKWFDSRQS